METTPVAPTAERLTFELARLESFTQPWHWAVLIGVCAAVAVYVVWMYRRDSFELPRLLAWLLTGLRLLAFAGLLAVYLHPQWRSERDVVRNSRALLLVDTSLSMGRNDGESPSVASGLSRGQQVAAALSESRLLDELRQTHDVVVLRFDADLGRVAALPKIAAAGETPAVEKTDDDDSTAAAAAAESAAAIDWEQALAPRGNETRLGQALRQLIYDERNGPVSGIVLLSDGGQNAGIEPDAAVALAQEARLPIFAVGLGSDRLPVNVQVSDLLAPARAYPGDAYSVTGFVQARGLAGQTVKVELLSRAATDGAAAPADGGKLEGSAEVVLAEDGEVVPVAFELTPEEVGARTLLLRVLPPNADRNPRDNQREVDIEVVGRKSRVLLFAGGPMRDYIFLRNLLFRDKDVAVDVILQTGQPGISQDADAILNEFPSTREELYEYDCVVAFDPDWQALDAARISLLENWVAEQAGGLIVVAGPIHTDNWAQKPNMAPIRALYPVEFHRRFALLEDARYGSAEAWPIDFTREGLDAEFLWLDDTGPASQAAWAGFPGVFGYYSVRGPKPGATVYAYYSDPQAGSGDERPVYFAGQFYGSGRVFYLGSGEVYRLRRVDEAHFEQFYTKLIRHVSQGRLLRGTNRGVLLVERDRYLLGATVLVRAQLNNAQLEPLTADSVPLEVVLPDGAIETHTLLPVPGSEGTFAGQLAVYQEGSYRLELTVPDSVDERIARRIQVRVPDLESEDPRRNDALLSALASQTGGQYFLGLEAALGDGAGSPLAAALPDRRKTLPVSGGIDEEWDRQWSVWMLGLICGLLCLEWLIRRLAKLA